MKKIFKMLQIGRQYFPLNDVGRRFKVQDTVDYHIKVPKFFNIKPTKDKMFNMLMQVDMLNDYIERTVWEQIQKDNYNNVVAWCRISHIATSVHKDCLTISVDLLEEVK